jgi:hydrogenase-4 component F
MIFLLATPLTASLLMAVLPSRSVSTLVFEALHAVSVLTIVLLAGYLIITVLRGGEPIDTLGGWFYLDALGSVFVFLISALGLLTGWFSLSYLRHDLKAGSIGAVQFKQYYTFFNLFLFTMLLVVLSNNIIMMWISIEATTIVTVFLVGSYQTKLALEAAWKYIVVCTAGVAFGLYGTLLIYANAAEVLLDPAQAVLWTSLVGAAPQFDAMLIQIAFVFAVVGFGTKAGLFPMHTWLPDAHSEAPSPVSALLSGVLIKCAVLVIIRFYIIAVAALGPAFPQLVMLIIGIISVVIASLAVFSSDDLKRKLAYSSVKNIGVVALCLGFGGPLGIAAALLHCVMHGFTKALMFCISGNILMKYGTRSLKKISGIVQVAPTTAVLMIIGLFALSGFPPLAMFIPEVMAFVAGVSAGYVWIVVILGLALALIIAAFMLVVSRSVFRKAPEQLQKKDLGFMILAPEVIMVVVIVWFGVLMPGPLLKGVESATAIVMQQPDQNVLHNDPLLKDFFAAGELSGSNVNE